jgi:hypothetical protein
MKAGHEPMKAMLETCLEKIEASPEKNKDCMGRIKKSVMKRPQWTLSEHGRTDMWTGF